MNEHAYRNLVSGKTTGFAASLARLGLSILSIAYRMVIALRNLLFDSGLRKPQRTAVPMISVGNLTTGGTGKTPIVALIVQMMQEKGLRPAIVSRGYRSVDGEPNDEKRVLERLCPSVPHEQNASRIAAAREVTRKNHVEVLVMDDGFQHRQLHRDLDIVLIDATNPFGYDHLLPRGLLREPLSSLHRADIVLITRSDMVCADAILRIEDAVKCAAPKLAAATFRVEFRPTGVIDGNGHRYSLTECNKQPVMLVSGIGNPEAFAETCRLSGMLIVAERWFPDHHPYSPGDLVEISELCRTAGAVKVVTTLKDLVKLPQSCAFLAIEITAVFSEPMHFEALKSKLPSPP